MDLRDPVGTVRAPDVLATGWAPILQSDAIGSFAEYVPRRLRSHAS